MKDTFPQTLRKRRLQEPIIDDRGLLSRALDVNQDSQIKRRSTSHTRIAVATQCSRYLASGYEGKVI